MQEQVIVGSQEVEDLVHNEEEQSVDCVLVKAVGCTEAFLLPVCHLLVEQFVAALFQVSPPHLNSIITPSSPKDPFYPKLLHI